MQGSKRGHGLFGEVRIVSKYIGTALEYQCITKGSQATLRWEQLQQTYATIHTINLLMPIETLKRESGEDTSWKIAYGDYFFLLDHERGNRQNKNDRFTEPQLWYLLYNMVNASQNMSKVGLHLNTPCGDTILLNQYGNIQIFCQLSAPNYKQILQTRKLTFSPQELQAKNNPTLNFGLDRLKSQAFNIGITMLELGTLKKCDKIYDKNQIKEAEIIKMLQEFSQYYNIFLTKIIASMVKLDPTQRTSTGEIYSAISPYSMRINNIQGFNPQREESSKSLRNYLVQYYSKK